MPNLNSVMFQFQLSARFHVHSQVVCSSFLRKQDRLSCCVSSLAPQRPMGQVAQRGEGKQFFLPGRLLLQAAIVVVDGQTDMHPTDEEVARMIQKDFLSKGINVYLAVNKCEAEGLEMEMNVGSYWNMGIGEPHPVSGIHGKGLYELLQDVCYNNFKPMDDFIDDRMIKVALVGRPNVGKSSLLNRCHSTPALSTPIPCRVRLAGNDCCVGWSRLKYLCPLTLR